MPLKTIRDVNTGRLIDCGPTTSPAPPPSCRSARPCCFCPAGSVPAAGVAAQQSSAYKEGAGPAAPASLFCLLLQPCAVVLLSFDLRSSGGSTGLVSVASFSMSRAEVVWLRLSGGLGAKGPVLAKLRRLHGLLACPHFIDSFIY